MRVGNPFDRVGTTCDFANIFPTFAKRDRNAAPQRIVVFDDEDAGRGCSHGFSASIGTRNRNEQPEPVPESSSSVPP